MALSHCIAFIPWGISHLQNKKKTVMKSCVTQVHPLVTEILCLCLCSTVLPLSSLSWLQNYCLCCFPISTKQVQLLYILSLYRPEAEIPLSAVSCSILDNLPSFFHWQSPSLAPCRSLHGGVPPMPHSCHQK